MRRWILGIAVLLAASQAFGQLSFSKLRFSASSQPEMDGSTISANLSYAFSASFSSSLRLRRLVTAETGELALGSDPASGKPVATASQNLERSDVTEVFILPAEFTLNLLGPHGVVLGAGLYVSFSSIRDLGFFKLDASIPSLSSLPATNSYDSSSSARYLGPVLTMQTEFSGAAFSFRPQLVFVPVFFFSETSTLGMDPLFSAVGSGVITYASYGLPYLAISGTGKLFNVLGLELSYTMSRQNAQLISAPDSSHASWWGDPKAITNSAIRMIGNIIIPLGGSGELRLGAGPDFSTSTVEGGASTTTTKPIFNIEYSINN